jgi:type I restriction enzyme S subunit
MPALQLDNLDKSTWQTFRFEQIARSISERVEPSQTDLETYVGLEHIDPESIHIKRFGSKDDVSGTKLRCYPGDVIFGRRRAYQRKAAICEFDGFCSAHSLVLRANPNVIDPKLFPFFLHSDTFMHRAVDISVGSLSPTINWTTLKTQEFLLPPKDQQAKLAELLWAADAAEQSNRKVAENLRKAQRSLERGLFRQREMKREKISDVASIQRGRFTPRPRNDPKYFGGPMPFVQTAQIIASRLWVDSYDQTLNDLGVSVSKVFPKETIVMVIAGTYVGSVAKLAFESAFTDSLLGIRAKPSILENDYLFYYLRHFETQVDSLATEVAQRNLSIAGLQDFEITFPKDLKQQRKVISEIERFERICEEAQIVAAQAKRVRQSLINQIF